MHAEIHDGLLNRELGLLYCRCHFLFSRCGRHPKLWTAAKWSIHRVYILSCWFSLRGHALRCFATSYAREDCCTVKPILYDLVRTLCGPCADLVPPTLCITFSAICVNQIHTLSGSHMFRTSEDPLCLVTTIISIIYTMRPQPPNSLECRIC